MEKYFSEVLTRRRNGGIIVTSAGYTAIYESEDTTMNDYEAMRTEFIGAIGDKFTPEALRSIAEALDSAASRYEIERKCTDLAVYGETYPPEVKNYIVSKKIEGLSDLTLKNKLIMLRCFFDAVRKPVSEITTNDIRVYIFGYKEARGVSDRTLDKVRQGLNAFFEWCLENDLIMKNPARKIKPIKYAEKQREAMTQMELETVRSACVNALERAIVEFLYSTGCRAAELCNVKMSDIDRANGTVTLFGKGKKYRVGYLNARCLIALKAYIDERGRISEYLFTQVYNDRKMTVPTVERIVRGIVERTGGALGKHITPHVFRHTTATQALRNGMPMEHIQRMLGHSNIATTQIYAEVTQEDVRESHERFVI